MTDQLLQGGAAPDPRLAEQQRLWQEYYAQLEYDRGRRVWPIYVVFVILCFTIIAIAIGAGVVAFIMHSTPGSRPPDPSVILAEFKNPAIYIPLFLANAAACAGAAILPAILSRTPWRQRLQLAPPRASAGTIAIMCIAILGLAHFLESLALLTGLMPDESTVHLLSEMFADARGWRLALNILTVGIAVPIGEELAFRGYFLTGLDRRHGPILAILISSLMFGLVHFDLFHSPYAFGLGLFLGYITLRTGSILPAIACHMATNIAATLFAAFPHWWPFKPGAAMLITSAALFLVAGAWAHRATRPPGGGPPFLSVNREVRP